MGRNALVVAASAAIFSACKNNNEQVPHLPANGTLSNLLPLSINKTDAEEIQNYGAFLDFYKVAEKELGIVLQNEKLGNIVGETASYDEMLPIFIKESRFIVDAKSRTGAIGYGQLQTGTIETVTRWLKNSGISKTYTPNTNPSDNLLYSTLYMSYLKNDVKKYFEGTDGQVNENELLLFAIASYNLWINKRKTLHTASGKVDTREKFARYLVKELMKLNGRWEKVTDDSYGVEYVNYFGDTDFSRDETIIFRNQGQYLHTLTKSKAQEVVRYVEIIIGLQQQLAKEQPAFDHIQIENNQLYAGIKNRLSQKEVSTAVKAGSTGNALINQILLDNGYTMKWVGTDTIYGVTVNAAIITPYLVDDAFKKYTYNVENYNKAEKRFLWSVVNELIQDNTFLKSLKELQIDTDRDDLKEEYSVIRQYALEAIVRFNQERRLNRSETSSDDVWIPEERYFHEYGRVRKIETNLVAQKEQEGKEAERITAQESQRLTTGKLYIDPKLDNLGEKIKEGATTFAVISIYNK